jgi:sterol desaturase/sphingolipid hydroxylase (fatty acid hydroxylase superfamily)
MSLPASKAWWSHLPVLVWPGIMVASLATYGALVHSFGMSYEVALQVHFLVMMVSIFLLELLMPYHRRWNTYDRQGWNDFLYNFTFPAAQLVAALFAVWLTKQQNSGHHDLFGLRLPFVVQLVELTLVIDLIYYVCHRAFHTLPLLWKLHGMHHNSEQLHVLNNSRVHPFEVFVFFFPISLAAALLDVPVDLLNWYFALQLTVGLLTHSNIAVRSGWLSWVFNTPELHHWHHSRVRKEHDNNYGSVTMVWDHLFRSYFNPSDRRASPDIGADIEVPASWFGQLAIPFRSSAKRSGARPAYTASQES